MDANVEPLILAVGPGGRQRQGKALQLRVSMEAAPELVALMRAEGVYAGSVIQESADIPTLAAFVASFAGGLGGIATVMNAWLTRNRHRAFLMERDGTRFEASGMSQEDMETLVERVVGNAAERQLETEHLYRGIPGAEPPEPQ